MKFSRVAIAIAFCLVVLTQARCAFAAEGGGDIDPLARNPDLAIWTGVIFLVLLFVLKKFAWGPLASGLDKRESMIARQIDEARESNEKAKQLLARYDEKLVEAKEEVRAIIEQGKQDAKKLGQEIVAKAKGDAETERQHALDDIDKATAEAMTGLARKSADLAVSLAGQIVSKQLDSDSHASLIERAVTDFGDTPKKG